ncbi:MAG TPA: antibiotic biosynthesis monooxygenase [Xanthobacteraceae bacterium]|nr:antibiotic biosynthesis monooxygenase [Xanthobacteraceae bacterium]
MFAVIFEVQPREGRFDEYLALAKHLKPELEAIDGFIANERFTSTRTAGKILSLSIWRNDIAVARWRSHGEHHAVQCKGRSEVFADYHLRVGEIVSDSAPPPGTTLEQQRFDTTEAGGAKLVTLTEVVVDPAAPDALRLASAAVPQGAAVGPAEHEVFESISNPGKFLLLAGWRETDAGERWTPQPTGVTSFRHRRVRIVRDYGMFDRREAPQFHASV